jgi:hypothetical protein
MDGKLRGQLDNVVLRSDPRKLGYQNLQAVGGGRLPDSAVRVHYAIPDIAGPKNRLPCAGVWTSEASEGLQALAMPFKETTP